MMKENCTIFMIINNTIIMPINSHTHKNHNKKLSINNCYKNKFNKNSVHEIKNNIKLN